MKMHYRFFLSITGLIILMAGLSACASNAQANKFAQSPGYPVSQFIEIPGWMKPGMSLENVRQELEKSNNQPEKISAEEDCYEFISDENIFYHLDILPEQGLIFIWIRTLQRSAGFQDSLSYLTRKFGIPERDKDDYEWTAKIDNDTVDIILYLDGDSNEWINIEYEFW